MKLQFLILACFLFLYLNTQTVLLTPILPPSAFQNQFYQVRFRVRNLLGAKFQFNNVPQFFSASSQGLLSGVPTKQGLYAIEVVYSNDTFKASQQVIIQVRRGTKLTDYNSEKTQQKQSSLNSLKPKEQYLYTYQQNDELDIQVNITNGLSPYKFEPIYIPQQLTFNNKTGAIEGSFHHYGDYLIGIKVKDAKNRQIQILIKITIQNKKDSPSSFIFYRRSMLQINFQAKKTIPASNNNTLSSISSSNASASLNNNAKVDENSSKSFKQNKSSLQQTQKNTQNGGGSIIIPPINNIKTENKLDSTNKQQNDLNSKTTNNDPNINLNNNSNNNADIASKSSASNTAAKIPEQIAKTIQTDSKTPPEIVSTQQIMNNNITNHVNVQQIEHKKASFNQLLQKSKDELKICYQNVQKSRSTVDNLHNAYSQQNAKVQMLKDQLQSLKTKSTRAKVDLQYKLDRQRIIQTEKLLAQRQYNRSLHSFQNVNYAYNGSLMNIQKNNQNINKIQQSIESYKRQLDKYYKILDDSMSINKKSVQQKQKINEQIKKGYGLMSKINLKGQNFSGCQNYKFYPKTTGVGQVKKVLDKIYMLTNNQFVSYGQCSSHEKVSVGDFVTWKGYIKDNIISALILKKADSIK